MSKIKSTDIGPFMQMESGVAYMTMTVDHWSTSFS